MLTQQMDRYIENGMLAQRTAGRGCDAEKAAMHSAEQRLRQLNIVKGRLEDSRREYSELKDKGNAALKRDEASMVSLIKTGMRLSPEEGQIGRAACRGRGKISVVAVSIKTKNTQQTKR